MITGEIRSKVDKLWEAFWSGGISNPLTVIEQVSYLLFIKRLDDIHIVKEKKANRLGIEIEKPIFTQEEQDLRWSRFKDFEAEQMHSIVMNKVFPFMKDLASTSESYAKYMADAIFMIQKPGLLVQAVDMINEIPMDDRDTKGDLYEYMLSKLSTSGQNGQFRTPRHIIKMMVELMQPKADDIICDPACGSAGFLVGAGEYLREKRPEIFNEREKFEHFNKNMFKGFDFDITMLRIGCMNMILHGVENPHIDYKDSLSEDNSQEKEECTLILANPPFKGSIDKKNIAKNLLSEVNTAKTELLFLPLMLRLLKVGGRCAVIVPDGVLFGASKAHKDVRKSLVDKHKLEAVISMPSGVFKPYAGVSTGILIFTKTNSGGTDKVWFYDMKADGYSLDDKRNEIEDNDIPDIIEKFHSRYSVLSNNCHPEQNNNPPEFKNRHMESNNCHPERSEGSNATCDSSAEPQNDDRKAKNFFVPVDEIKSNDYDLSINRYKEIEYEEVQYDQPEQIFQEVSLLEAEIQDGLKELEGLLR